MQHTTLTFPFLMHAGDIRAFRAALVECVGLGHYLFHGHDNSVPGQTKYTNAYPLIRFGLHRGQAQVTGLGRGAAAIVQHLLPVLPKSLSIAGRCYDTSGYHLHTSEWTPEIRPNSIVFGLHHWVALNKANYEQWKALEGREAARRMLLDRCLTGHLRALAEACDPSLDRQQIAAEILKVDGVKRLRWHNTQLVGFRVVAQANFLPPPGWGLGRCLSFGFGEVCTERAYYALQSKRRRVVEKR